MYMDGCKPFHSGVKFTDMKDPLKDTQDQFKPGVMLSPVCHSASSLHVGCLSAVLLPSPIRSPRMAKSLAVLLGCVVLQDALRRTYSKTPLRLPACQGEVLWSGGGGLAGQWVSGGRRQMAVTRAPGRHCANCFRQA
ncbi:hypothetical protein GN956_G24622 [Arapaima gigas]